MTTPPKQLLIVRVSNDVQRCETKAIQSAATAADVKTTIITVVTEAELTTKVMAKKKKYDFIYICGHGNSTHLHGDDGTSHFQWEWSTVSAALCNRLNEEALLLLGCCDGGLRVVSWQFFEGCPNLLHVIGTSESTYAEDLAAAFYVILYATGKRCSVADAVERAAAATRQPIKYRRREEEEITQDYIYWFWQRHPPTVIVSAPPSA